MLTKGDEFTQTKWRPVNISNVGHTRATSDLANTGQTGAACTDVNGTMATAAYAQHTMVTHSESRWYTGPHEHLHIHFPQSILDQ